MRARDVCVIGAGVIGLSCAWQLARAGRRVEVVDPFPASGASHVAAGMLAPITEASYGERELAALCLAAAAAWPAFADQLQADSGLRIGHRSEGALLVALDQADHDHLRDLHGYHHELGLDSVLHLASACREIEPSLSPLVRAGIWAPQDHQVDNRALLDALVVAARAAGVMLRVGRARVVCDPAGALVGVAIDDEVVSYEQVLVAAGFESRTVVPEALHAELPLRPVKGQILRIGLAEALAPQVIVRGFVAGRSVYVVPRGGGRIVIGATVEDQGEDRRVTTAGLRILLEDATAVLPGLCEAELLEAAVGFRPGTPDNLAIIGPSSLDRVFLATGHYRNGILFAPFTAAVITEAMASGRLARGAAAFSPVRFLK